MGNLFNSVKQSRPRSNAFNLSYDKKISFKFGDLIPIHLQECIPGDIFRGNTQVFMRLAPMLAPMMHQVDLYCHYFFVPNRILWPQWESFITGNEDATPPFIACTDGQVDNGSLGDHFGMPSSDVSGVAYSSTYSGRPDRQINAFPFAAYQRIWFEYYRDQNLENSDLEAPDLLLSDGHNAIASSGPRDWLQIRQRAWQKDYFASALPWAQKGATMMVPFGFDEDVPVYHDHAANSNFYRRSDDNPSIASGDTQLGDIVSGYAELKDSAGNDIHLMSEISGYKARTTDLALGSGSIEELRTAFRLQEWLERNARGGTRYVESILSHFGIRVRDYRLDRPEYIGGGKNIVQVSEVLQTTEPIDGETGTPLGTMGGHGISAGYAGSYNYRVEEHGFIMGILSVRPRPAYYMGMPRHFLNRKDRLDYYWPSFAHLGEQEIWDTELMYDSSGTEQTGEFGYTPRYAEYRRNYSTVAGDFNTTLDFWHLARKFPSQPQLNADFTQVNSPDVTTDIDRIFAVQDGTDYFWAHIVHDIKAIRPMPRFATPRI